MYKRVDYNTYIRHSDTEIAGFFGPYRWLSNFHLQEVEYEGLLYSSNEHAYQAAKWPSEERAICLTMTPAEVKAWGRKAPLDPNWDTKRLEVMKKINEAKYTDPELRTKLIGTFTKKLIELNHWNDNFWGEDYRCPNLGQNKLGEILTDIRRLLIFEGSGL